MKLTFLGCGDAFGSGGRFNTCFLVEASQASFLIDCGASSMVAIRHFGVDPNRIDAILIGHLHGDHFGGLPFFLLDAQLVSRRTRPLLIAGPPGLRARLETAMECFFPGSSRIEQRFPLEILELEPRVERAFPGFSVTPYVVKHACGAPPFALRVAADGRTLCYSGDTEWVDNLAEAARDVDLFVAEAYFADKPIRWHLDMKTLLEKYPSTGARRLALTHLGPDMLARLGDLPHVVAEDGKTIEI
jgi:ribonuclease BN (tRNA processing enzyme)